MAYEKQVFIDGETILSAAHLIHMEEGIASAHEMGGTAGEPGKDGEDGSDGATFTPTVSASGDLSWTNDKGLTNPETVNIKGPQGDKGDPGDNIVPSCTSDDNGKVLTVVDGVPTWSVATGGSGESTPSAEGVEF